MGREMLQHLLAHAASTLLMQTPLSPAPGLSNGVSSLLLYLALPMNLNAEAFLHLCEADLFAHFGARTLHSLWGFREIISTSFPRGN